MSESAKTFGLVAAAAVVVLLVWVTRPVAPQKDSRDQRGELLVTEFDPQTAASVEIMEFDEDTATVRPFKVAKTEVKGKKGKTRWSIPSHENYPTDAKDQLADVAAGLMGLKILEVVGDSPGDHALYGVRDPDPKTLKVGDTGVGTRITMKDAGDKDLLSLVIGKAVPDKPELRYVRRVGSDTVYVVAAKTDKISTQFEKWIEKDLLKLSAWDIKQLWVRDYSVDQLNGVLVQRGNMTLEYNDTGDPKWKLIKDEKLSRSGEWAPVKLADNEELNTAKLDEMKNALGDLKIVDVSRKPEGLSADLKAGTEFAKNREAVTSLATRGFFLAKVGDQPELFSNEGEFRCQMKDGVQYILRFGEIAPDTTGSSQADKDKEKEPGAEGQKPKSTGLNRYLFVNAEFNSDVIPKPELEPLPGEKKENAATEKPTAEKPAAEKPAGEKKAEDKKAEDKKAAESQAPEKSAEQAKPEDLQGEPDDSAAPTGVKDEAKSAAQQASSQADKDEQEPASAEKKPAAEDKKSGSDGKTADDKAAADAERERIEKENKRKQEEYDEKVKKGKERVTELNARFADWYYIISDEVYRKLHLTRQDIIKKKEKDKAAAGADKGDQGGVNKPVPEDNPPADNKETPAAKD